MSGTGKRCVLAAMLLGPIMASAGGALRIEILRGEGANNNTTSNVATSPVVRVYDAKGPVPDALVVFTGPDTGASAVFSGSGNVGEAVTDESGTAASPRMQPVGGNGPVSIRVMASKNGEFADVVIHQMNLGLGESGAREAELDIVQVHPERTLAPARELSFRVRVDDGRDRPVPRAGVAFALRRIDKSGKVVELEHTRLLSDERGEAQYTAAKRPGGARIELEVQAEMQGRRATRYFPLN